MLKIHPTAKVHPTVVFGDCDITIGADTVIGPFCLIGMPGEHRTKVGVNHGVVIGERCRVEGLVTIDGGIEEPTQIEGDVMLMKHSHVGHDAYVGDRVTISCGAKIGGHACIHADANIGLNAVIHQNHVVREWCMIGMGAVLPLKVETLPGMTYVGNPARLIGLNKKAPTPCFYSEQEKAGIQADWEERFKDTLKHF